MKLNKISLSILGVALLFSMPSCKKFLEQSPDNRAEINTVEKLSQLVSTAYPSRDYITFTEASSDNAEDKGEGIGYLTDVIDLPYAWQDVIGDATNSSTAYWNACYEAIAAANQALESIETNKLGNAALPYKGEALVCRAYAHFMLATLFATPYKIGGTNTAPGIPYVDKPETKVIQPYSRGTVASTYERIRLDLEAGLPLLQASAYKIPKYHFTPEAAHAFAARFYLFTGAWQKVIDHATLAVPGNDFTNNMRQISTTLRLMTYPDFLTNFMGSGQKYNLLLLGTYSTYARFITSSSRIPRHGFGVKMASMFATGKNVTGKALANNVLTFGGIPNYTSYKFKENFYYTTPDIGYPYLTFAGLTVDEALMNRAEAYAELGQNEMALKDINDFYSVRIVGYNPSSDAVTLAKITNFYPAITDAKQGLIRTILDAKKAEFLQEGLRWFDIVRRDITVVHNTIDITGKETFAELKPGDPHRIFQLPLEVKTSGVELNPR
ncbi:RagB/SusD family nutrient uptake outer membrane protein [Pedobacter sp. KR3-3]|uniref:RagB/SusD family nutrient uptake outer membrane protein n=1 Tax=Pedobacter albus TaxID=3113905 RepID=A0ABU7I9K4_9SPHI|nr:RagB/SusD family nutrient uptake outer membrane protein [Pedobacter sp. KR3-3]MEE1946039.1 RagB/SusD family nutrient uptake outer membrane protein [Pedobacter sp. KR3-3]